MRIANVNIFVTSLILAEAILIFPLMIPVEIAIKPFRSFMKDGETWMILISSVLILLSLIIVAIKFDLSPRYRKPGLEVRYRKGHRLLVITHAIVIISIVTPFIMAWLSNKPEQLFSIFIITFPTIGVAFFAWVAGLIMVWGTRA